MPLPDSPRLSARRLLDDALAAFVRVMLGAFFRRVEIVGLERIPRGVPLLVVASHVNSLVDPLLILGFLGLRPRILAKSTLWRHPVVAPLLVLGGAVPVYRRQDGAPVSRNLETFSRCRRTLARGNAVLLFPEGASHSKPHRLPLKTGAARIALETEEQHGVLGLRILPVGLTYEAKGEFRSRVLLFVGDPIDPAPERALYASQPRAAVKALTERMAEELDGVTASHGSWEEARLVDRAVGIVSGIRGFEAQGASLAGRFRLRERVVREHEALKSTDPARAARLADAVAHFDAAVSAEGLGSQDLEDVGASSELRRGEPVALLLPTLVGTILNWIPFRVTGWLAGRFAQRPDDPATYKLLAALLTFPTCWALEAAAGMAFGGALWGLAIAILAPLSGVAALHHFGRPGRPRLEGQERVLGRLREERERLKGELAAALAPDVSYRPIQPPSTTRIEPVT